MPKNNINKANKPIKDETIGNEELMMCTGVNEWLKEESGQGMNFRVLKQK
jgi:hypothetical protein